MSKHTSTKKCHTSNRLRCSKNDLSIEYLVKAINKFKLSKEKMCKECRDEQEVMKEVRN